MTDQPPVPPVAAPAMPTGPDFNMIKIPLLISAIFNCLVALGWVSTCFLFFLAIPLVVLAVFEFMLFSKFTNPSTVPPRSKVQMFAILECCTIVLGNVPSLICGILILVNLDKSYERPV